MAQPRRADEGTAKKLELGYKIGGDFKIQGNSSAPFLATRLALFDKLYAEQQQKFAAKERPIEVTLPDGKVVEATAFKTTPLDIALGISKGLADKIIVSRVLYTESTTEEGITAADSDDEESEDEVACCGDHANALDNPFLGSQLWDCNRPLVGNCKLWLLKFEDPDAQKVFWHSSAHVLGQALEREYGAHLTNGPALRPGFYYDSFVGNLSFSNDHVSTLEKSCQKIVKENQKFEYLVVTKTEALQLFEHNPFKLAIINSKIEGDNTKTSVYKCGSFIDLCLGPHVPSTGRIKHLALTKNSSAYFLGDNKNDSLQRVYGVSFPEKSMLDEYIRFLEEAKKRDHRVLGANQELFFFESNMAAGSAFWLPRGAILYNKLIEFMRNEYRIRNFQEVITPNMFHCDLWKTSGHYQKYADCMFILNVEGAEWGLKPMNCPGHCLLFRHVNPSYKQLPMRIADFGVLHRNEFSGTLSGLTRVRRFQQDDAHIFCTMEQVCSEVSKALEFLFYVYDVFGFEYSLKLSTRPENRLGSDDLWDVAEDQLKQALETTGKNFSYKIGDGAFYGPKIDIQLFDALKRNHQCGTIQLDFQLPIRFDLQYRTNENIVHEENKENNAEAKENKKENKKDKKEKKKQAAANAEEIAQEQADECCKEQPKEFVWEEKQVKPGFARPVIVHRAILGSIERMTAILTEHYAGKFPFWLSPRQAVVLPISDKYNEYAEYVCEQLKLNNIECAVDVSGHTIKRKVLDAQMQKWNYMLVVGQQEMDKEVVMLRNRENPEDQEQLSIPDLITKFKNLSNISSVNLNVIKPFRDALIQESNAEIKQE